MSDFDEVKRSVSELLQFMEEYIRDYKRPLVPWGVLEVVVSPITGISPFPGVEVKRLGLKKPEERNDQELRKKLNRMLTIPNVNSKNIGLPHILGASITVIGGESVYGQLLLDGDDLTADQQGTVDALVKDWDVEEDDVGYVTPHIEKISGHETITQKSNELFDCLLDIASKRKKSFKEMAYVGAELAKNLEGQPKISLCGWNIHTGTDSKSEALRTEVEIKMNSLNEALMAAELPKVRYVEIKFWPRTRQISLEMSFPTEASSEEEAVLKDLERCWFKHLNNLHETDGQYCPGCGKTKCRN